MEQIELDRITETLKQNYPNASCELNYKTPYELLIATVLSAQCTDVRVNKVTPELFSHADTPEKMTKLGYDKIYELIKTCGLASSKAKNILELSDKLICDFGGKVPSDMNSLISLPGVGRKTANVVMANAFKVPTIAVDTHVFRVSNRIGYANEKDVLKTEHKLMQVIDKNDWILMHHILIHHGRAICHARNPECENCCIKDMCQHYNSL